MSSRSCHISPHFHTIKWLRAQFPNPQLHKQSHIADRDCCEIRVLGSNRMEGRHQQEGLGQGLVQGRHQQQASGTMVLVASVTGLAIGGSLLGLMGLSFLASLTLLLFSSPLLLIFSPLLFLAAFVFVGSLVGFAAAAAMALTGMSALGWIYQEVGGQKLLSFGGEDMAGRVKEQGKGWGTYLEQGGSGI